MKSSILTFLEALETSLRTRLEEAPGAPPASRVERIFDFSGRTFQLRFSTPLPGSPPVSTLLFKELSRRSNQEVGIQCFPLDSSEEVHPPFMIFLRDTNFEDRVTQLTLRLTSLSDPSAPALPADLPEADPSAWETQSPVETPSRAPAAPRPARPRTLTPNFSPTSFDPANPASLLRSAASA